PSYSTRSQPPLRSSAVRAVWDAPRDNDQRRQKWLEDAVALLTKEYHTVWNGQARTPPACIPDDANHAALCLSTYHALGVGEPPEVEDGHFDWMYTRRASALGMQPSQYRQQLIQRSLPASELHVLDPFFLHDRSMRDSGHDTTYR